MKRILFVTVLGFFTLNTIAQKEKEKNGATEQCAGIGNEKCY